MAKKKRKAALPKRFAGVKIPKRVRRSRLGQLLATPLGQQLLAGSAVAAGGALAANQAKPHSAARQLGADLRRGGSEMVDQAEASASAFAFALGEAARSFADALQHGKDRTGRPAWADSAYNPSGETAKLPKKKSDEAPVGL